MAHWAAVEAETNKKNDRHTHTHTQARNHAPVISHSRVDCVWNVMAHAQKPDFVFRAKRTSPLPCVTVCHHISTGVYFLTDYKRTSPFKSTGGRQFSRLLAAEVCASAVIMLDTPCSEVVWRVLATHCIRQFPLHFPLKVRHRVPSHFNWTLSAMPLHGPHVSQYVSKNDAIKPQFVKLPSDAFLTPAIPSRDAAGRHNKLRHSSQFVAPAMLIAACTAPRNWT